MSIEWRKTDARSHNKPVYRLSKDGHGIAWVSWDRAGERGGCKWVVVPDGVGFRGRRTADTLGEAWTIATELALDCASSEAHHSTDRTFVYDGHEQPSYLCGYHASRRAS